ncbi:hypothetical protein IF1G_01829 [Cordyceps javanica]|uniref:Uncharacterized protein n=1 Tax=Cordyceps javanica TaxID=43265 RepID=A0A545VD19_9HYPO|nr:hypothetical protein IF1G_01829 [Cordyceps javanica]
MLPLSLFTQSVHNMTASPLRPCIPACQSVLLLMSHFELVLCQSLCTRGQLRILILAAFP